MPSAYDTLILGETGLLAYWPLNDSASPASDATGNGHNLTLETHVQTLQTSLLPADAEKAMTWPNTVSSDSTAASPAALAIGRPLSVEYWIKYSTVGLFNTHVVSVGSFTQGGGWGVGHDSSGDWLFTGYTRADNHFSSGPTAGTVYHVVFTVDASGNCIVSVNGSAVQTLTGVAITAAGTVFEIGGTASDGTFVQGTLQKVAVYNVVLTPTQISNHYNTGTATNILGTVVMGTDGGGLVASPVVVESVTAGTDTGGLVESGVAVEAATMGALGGGIVAKPYVVALLVAGALSGGLLFTLTGTPGSCTASDEALGSIGASDEALGSVVGSVTT